MKKEIFNRIIDCGSTITEIDKEDILSNKKNSDIIEARCLIITYCKRYEYNYFIWRDNFCV